MREGIKIGVLDLYCIKPISSNLLKEIENYKFLISVEEQCLDGGYGSALLEFFSDNDIIKNVTRMGLPNRYFFENGGREYLLDLFGLSLDHIKNTIIKLQNEK